MPLKDGKKPLSAKPNPAVPKYGDLFGDATTLSEELKKELEEQGLVGRWVDYKRLKEMDGYHTKGWILFRRKKSDIIDSQEFRFGQNPDGIVRRGSMVLAAKTKEEVEKHKAFLKDKAERYGKHFKKRQAAELRQLAKDGGLDTQVVEGYDD